MKQLLGSFAVVLACTMLSLPRPVAAQVSNEALKSISTPDKVEMGHGSLEFKDGAPTTETVQKVYDNLDYVRGVDAFMNSFSGASAYAIREGFHSIGAQDNTVVIFSGLIDSNSLFLTANADIIYTVATLDLTKGPLVVEVPPMALGTINDMWFGWIVDIGFAGPDRGEGGKYLIVPPGYEGPLPDSGFNVGWSRTTHVLYAVRAFMDNNDPKPAVAAIKKSLKIYPYTLGGFGTSIATALEGKVMLEGNPPISPTKFVEGSGKSFNTIPPNDFSYFEMVNELVQMEPATSFSPELSGQLAAIGIVKGKPFKPDDRMKKILTDAAAMGNVLRQGHLVGITAIKGVLVGVDKTHEILRVSIVRSGHSSQSGGDPARSKSSSDNGSQRALRSQRNKAPELLAANFVPRTSISELQEVRE